jgi:hypothetical protein
MIACCGDRLQSACIQYLRNRALSLLSLFAPSIDLVITAHYCTVQADAMALAGYCRDGAIGMPSDRVIGDGDKADSGPDLWNLCVQNQSSGY